MGGGGGSGGGGSDSDDGKRTMTQMRVPEAAHRVLVCLEQLHIVHVGLPVFDKTSCVAGHHPLVIVGPHHRTNTAVVGLFSEEEKKVTSV